ncbi:hypothetical protein [Streptomyces sp. NPDC001536]
MSAMVTALAVSVLLILVVTATRVFQRLEAVHASRTARRGRAVRKGSRHA